MRLLSICILLLSLISLPCPVLAKKAATIDELAQMYDIKPCAECHEDKYEQWKSSTMGNSVIDLRVLRGMRTFIRLAIDEEESLKREDLTICLNCHAPQIKDASPELVVLIGDLVLAAVEDNNEATRDAAKKELSKLNLNCLVCHNLKATGFDVQPKAGVIYVPDDIDDTAHKKAGFATVKTGFLGSSEFCAQCHHCPPDVPWKDCPTLYTTYMEDFIHNGRKETCQDCHMNGKQRNHKFFGPNDPGFLESSINLSLNTRLSRYIDIYENKKMPVAIVKVEIRNNTGHVIPHGCLLTPKMFMNLKVLAQDGKEIFSKQKEFSVGDLYFKGGKQVAMAEWDITATEHFDMGIKADEPDLSTFIIPLKVDTSSVNVEVTVQYLFSKDKTYTIGKAVQKLIIEK